jgi:hypothetical protein
VRVEHGHNFDREETLFRLLRREATWPHPEFSIVDAVFDDHPAPEICAILEAQQLVERSIKAPGFRFRLGREGLAPDMELLVVVCDGRNYRVTRGLNMMVVIYDESGKPLEAAPSFAALPARIFDRSTQQWRDDIRSWRGPGQ